MQFARQELLYMVQIAEPSQQLHFYVYYQNTQMQLHPFVVISYRKYMLENKDENYI